MRGRAIAQPRNLDLLVRVGQHFLGNTVAQLDSSASWIGVRKAIAMSLLIWSPAIGITAVWRIAPR